MQSIEQIKKDLQVVNAPASPFDDRQRAFIAECLFIKSVVAFETYLEEYFLAMVTGQYKPTKVGAKLLVEFDSEETARRFVFDDQDYATWLPYSVTQDRAKRFFQDGRPFCGLLHDGLLIAMSDAVVVRNHAVHASASARKKFVDRCYRGVAATTTTTGQHLQAVAVHKHGKAKQRVIDTYINTFVAIAQVIDPN